MLRLLPVVIAVAACAAREHPSTPARAFRHPGLLNDARELALLHQRVQSEAEPWASAFHLMERSRWAALDRAPGPRAVVDCGPYSNPDHGCTEEKGDAVAAYTQALLWQVTGDPARARKAREILDAWSATLTAHTGHNAPLESGWTASVFVRAAEIIRHTNAGWPAADVERFAHLLRTAYVPYIVGGSPTTNGNWELSMVEALMGIGVFLDDAALFDKAVTMWRRRVPAYFYLERDGALPMRPAGTTKYDTTDALVEHWHGQRRFVDGLTQETCRDFGHTLYGLAATVNAAEIARHQGVDLYGEEAERITRAMEFHAEYLLGAPTPEWLCGGRLRLSAHPATWEIAYNHFHNRAGRPLPLSERLIREKVRPTRADHHMVWESFTHGDLDGPPPAALSWSASPTAGP
jgi:hypothetical protein